MSRTLRASRVALLILGTALCYAPQARADFFDDARGTFENDIPHFFQDDIPCAFGGQPTSHTKTSCKEPDAAAKRPAATGAVVQTDRSADDAEAARRRDRNQDR